MGSSLSSFEVDDIASDENQYKEALHAIENGDDNAKTKVAFYKLSGRGGVEIDEKGAVDLLEERCKDDDSEAMWMLGLCCEYGMGIEQNIERANMLYEQSSGANVVGFFLSKSIWTERKTGVMHGQYWTSL